MTGLTVTELHTQDGWDWPNGVQDERWPVEKDRPVPVPVPPPPQLTMRAGGCVLRTCHCMRYSDSGRPKPNCANYHAPAIRR